MDRNAKILIVGGGTFGLSTAYSMARSGYTSIMVLESGESIPSPLSAANDLNKIIRAEYEDPFLHRSGARGHGRMEHQPDLRPTLSPGGIVARKFCCSTRKSKKSLAKSLKSVEAHPAWKGKITPIETRDDIRTAAPALRGPMEGWKSYLNSFTGYVHSGNALKSIYKAVLELSVVIRCSQTVTGIVYEEGKSGVKKCVGAKTSSGETFSADTVIVTVGACLASVLPQVGRQVVAKALCVAHIQLNKEQADRLMGIPVTYARDLGFFFEPDRETLQSKLCASGAGYTNRETLCGSTHSFPPQNNDIIPSEDEKRIRKLIREALPEFSQQRLMCKHLCWIADSAGSDFIFDFVPGTQNLIVASGDSGHGFKFLPTIGRCIQALVEQGAQNIPQWGWKEGNDASGNVSWRTGDVADLKDVEITYASRL